MNDNECVRFLQWALPQLGMRWGGFRRVRKQVCKRIQRRVSELGLTNVDDYRTLLAADSGSEWLVLDSCCRVTISRFFRDRSIFQKLGDEVLPGLAAKAHGRLRAWSAGCGSGEEPYSLALLWRLQLQTQYPNISFEIVASDASELMLQRAARAAYTDNTLRELPEEWRQMAFRERSSGWCLLPEYREPVALRLGDVRYQAPPGSFDLVLCRNLAFTYFDLKTQERVLSLFREHLVKGGALVLGRHETLPPSALSHFHHWLPSIPIYRHVGVETRCLRR